MGTEGKPIRREYTSPDDDEVNRWRAALGAGAAQIVSAKRGLATDPRTDERNLSVCMVHSLLNRTLDSGGTTILPDESDDRSSVPELEISEAPTPRGDSVQLLSKDAISELVTSIRGMSHNLSKLSRQECLPNLTF
jgi:hypothetical protein